MRPSLPPILLLTCIAAGPSGSQALHAAETIDYAPYAGVLAAYVNPEGYVDYRGLQQDRAPLDRFVRQLADLDPAAFARWPQKQQLALWINAYNALTLKAVIDHYPVDSIRDIGTPVKSVWDKLTFDVMDRSLTLNQIEHEILRKEFAEPRIHMAINCASIGCPPLLNQPFRADTLDQQFTTVTNAFLSLPSHFRIDRDHRTVYLSSIFKWFGEDFIDPFHGLKRRKGLNKKEQAAVNFVAGYLDQETRAFLDRGRLNVKYLEYDWGLNRQ